MKFTVLNKIKAIRYKPQGTAILISITDPASGNPPFHGTYEGIIRLQFHDINEQFPEGYFFEGVLFNSDDAKDILAFVKNHPDIDEIVVHCEAGVSRSAGVAAALSKIYLGDDTEFFGLCYIPNRLVYNTILNQHYLKD